jgi:hypothetical protein
VTPVNRKITSLLFILLGLAPLLYLFVTTVKKLEIWERMKEKLETHTLQTISLPEDKVVWMDKHEIWVNDQMFDIHSKKLEDGVYTFTGLYDEEETELVMKEKDAMEKNDEKNTILARLFQNIGTIFYNQPAGMGCLAFCHDQFSSLTPGKAVVQFREILTPPPQVGS